MAYILSKIIIKPIIELNSVDKKMAGLDFSFKYKITSLDELGELDKTINYLSYKLGDTIKELNKANKKLKEDIDKEKNLKKKERNLFQAFPMS